MTAPGDDEPPIPAEPQALNRPWLIWGTATVVAITALAAIVGFLILPSADEHGVAGALGAHAEHDEEWMATVADIPPPTNVAWTRATLALLEDGDATAGEAVAVQCAGCHGAAGIAPSPAFPSLAGQPATAIYKQLRDFADGYRLSPLMAGIAQALTDRQMADVARFYATRAEPPGNAADQIDADILRLTTHGDPSRGLPSCNSCHQAGGGPRGSPLLMSQPTAYLAAQLRAFASGDRRNDIYGLMRTVAGLLTPEEIEQLAVHYGI